MSTILFVCVHNAGRSQMAAGFARALGGAGIRVLSGGSEPEHPAPEFVVTAAESEHAGSTGAKNAAGHDAQAASPAAARDSSDGTARWLGGAGLALGLIALVVAGGVLGRSRRTKGI